MFHSREATFFPHLSSGFTFRSNVSSPEISPLPGSAHRIHCLGSDCVHTLFFPMSRSSNLSTRRPGSLVNESLVVVIVIEMVPRNHRDSLMRQSVTIPLS